MVVLGGRWFLMCEVPLHVSAHVAPWLVSVTFGNLLKPIFSPLAADLRRLL